MNQKIIATGGGFLLAVLWFDLMFDVQAWPYWEQEILPEEVLASIAGYYQRVTTDAWPMNLFVGAVMVFVLLTAFLRARDKRVAPWNRFTTLILAGAATSAGLEIAFPIAEQLGARTDDLAMQTELANTIFVTHVGCFIVIAVVLVLQFLPVPHSQQ
jgi:ABC-type Fe3+-siderophore transport system permease subunit